MGSQMQKAKTAFFFTDGSVNNTEIIPIRKTEATNPIHGTPLSPEGMKMVSIKYTNNVVVI